jgi:hypothetical protein
MDAEAASDDDRFGRRGLDAAVDGDANETSVHTPGGLPSSDKGNDGLGAHESVSEVVGEVFSGYTCHSIEVRARSKRTSEMRLLFYVVLKRSAHETESWRERRTGLTMRFIRFIRALNP